MRTGLLVVIGIIVLLAAIASLGGGDDVTVTVPGPTARTTSPTLSSGSGTGVDAYLNRYGSERSVYQRIVVMTDCAALQQQFDLASDNNDRAEAGTAEFKWTLGYMTAADERLEQIGCYD